MIKLSNKMTEVNMTIQQMAFLGLVTKDINASTKYYQEVLGLAVNETESIPDFYTQFDLNGGATFSLITGFEHDGVEQSFDSALIVEDVDAAYEKWQKAGVKMVNEPRDMPFGRTFLFETPDGHILRAMNKPQQM